MSWYVLFVRSGSECQVKTNLQRFIDKKDLRCVVPKRKISEKKCGQISCVEKVMFPGYVFVETKMNYSMYYILNEYHLVHRMLNYRNKKDLNNSIQNSNNIFLDSEEHYFKQMPYKDIEQIFELLNNEEVIEYSKVFIADSCVSVI